MFHPQGPTLTELVRQALSSTERGYDLLAPKFDFTPFRTPTALLRRVAPLVAPPGGLSSAVDLCCGTGAGLELLRPLCRDRLVGVDFSAGMLREAERRLAGAPGSAAVRLVKADVCRLRLTETFDVATCFGALGHVPPGRDDAFVVAVHRLLRPAGRFVFVTVRQPPWYAPGAVPARVFNLAMTARNALWSPSFVMFYLRFTLPGVVRLLQRHGFACDEDPRALRALDPRLVVVSATRS